MSDEKTLPPSLFANPGEHSQGKRNNFLIFLTLSLITLAQAFESTSLCVTLPVSLCPKRSALKEAVSELIEFDLHR